jgi:zinc protease
MLVDKYFGGVPRGSEAVKPKPFDVKIASTKRIVFEDKVELPRLYMYWLSTPYFAKDDAELDILSQILTEGKNSRLYKTLVYQKQIAQDVYAFQNGKELSGYFGIVVTGKENQSLKQFEKEVFSEIDKIVKENVSKRELEKVKNGIRANFIYSLQQLGGFGSKTDQLNAYNIFLSDPGKFNDDLERYKKVTANDVKRVAMKYLKDKPCVILSIVPKGKPELQAGE